MWQGFINCWKIPDLRRRLVLTLSLLVVCRVVAAVPCPGVDPDALEKLFANISDQASTGQLATMLNMFTGGAMQKFSVGALGIMPYITASIIMSLLTPVLPVLEKWKREGETGYQKITQWTRYLTLGICIIQGAMFAVGMQNPGQLFGSAGQSGGHELKVVVAENAFLFRLQAIVILTCGTMLLMWLGEKITERGIGQGASLVITIGIVDRMPDALYTMYGRTQIYGDEQLTIIHLFILCVFFAVVTAAVVALSVAVRQVPIQYARGRGGRPGGAQGGSFPLRLNYANVMPIIFGSTLLSVPPIVLRFLATSPNPSLSWLRGKGWMNWVNVCANWFNYATWPYMLMYGALVIFFCFFWVANQFNPVKIADDLKRNNAYVPGYRPGKETADFLDWSMTRVTTGGAIFLTVIALLPELFMSYMNVPQIIAYFFGGTSLLIMVGVMIDTLKQLEAHLLTHGGYETFLKSGKLRGRRPVPGVAGT